ncbi:discoidin domain-containing protein [Lysinibacillus agricola]|uniref:Discoidin domain-containing protein n=1 Tax=Lysinibacillus agricola TaxID=2590012 RepID=A0ABX7AM44_9BACI|nr:MULTISPECIES: discoidin domain-containing protein [Lysinibacillus]KOS61407.1 hypothetical protein AN161_17570 [Lysinibacillus sp. FJAT-14222]QQP10914.1 discoidin domain-containing protein [Lysinibacillus agricola]
MATIGQALASPESGWKRYDIPLVSDDIFKINGDYGKLFESYYYNGTAIFLSSTSSNLLFYFKGTSLRVTGSAYSTQSIDSTVNIDGDIHVIGINVPNSQFVGQALLLDVQGLEDEFHKVEIKKGVTFSDIVLDAVDINESGEFRFPYKKLALKNPTTSELYSLSDNTLIHLPNSSDKNMILHGIEQDKEIQLDVPFTKHDCVNESPVVNVSGKVFTQNIGKINTLSIKEVEESDNKPIYTWYSTNMTANNIPAPFIASASSEYNTTYQAWRAFDGITNVNAWLTVANTTIGWLKLDLGQKKPINIFKMTCRDGSTDAITKAMPKDFELYGSNDDSTYSLLGVFNNQVKWSFLEERVFTVNNSNEYRYLRLNILSNGGFTEYSNIGELIYGFKREV